MTHISVTRALAKVTHLDSQIEKAISRLNVVRVTRGKEENRSFTDSNERIEEFEKAAKAEYQSIEDMIAHRSKLKIAVNSSNAVTKVKIGSVEMTVAEAIQKKAQIETQEKLIKRLTQQFTNGNMLYTRELESYEQKEEKSLAIYGGRDKAPKEEELNIILKPLRDKQQPGLSDVLGVSEVIKKLQKEVDDFKLEVDFVLSESNASTQVEV